MAQELGHTNVATLLQTTLNEEAAADKKLTGIAESSVLAAANTAAGADVEDEDEVEAE